MKTKKYFCDSVDYVFSRIWFHVIILALCFISCCCTHNHFRNKYDTEQAMLSTKDYEQLEDVARGIYDKESKSLNLSNIPNNVILSNIEVNEENIEFTCTLDKNFDYTPNPLISVTIPNDFNNIKISLASKKMPNVLFDSILFGILFVLIPYLAIASLLLIFYKDSITKKHNDEMEKMNKSNGMFKELKLVNESTVFCIPKKM